MAVKDPKPVEADPVEAPEVEASNVSDEVLGIYIRNSTGEVLGHGYESVEAAEAHISAHLTDTDCEVFGG